MKILYHLPTPESLNAGRTIYYGYKDAFEGKGHEFRTLTQNDDSDQVFESFQPDIFFTSVGILNFKYLDLAALKKQKKKGMKVFVNIPFWHSPLKGRINETPSVSENPSWVQLIKSGDFGDVYYNICEQGDPRMDGFERTTGYKHYTILLAANTRMIFPEYDDRFASDLCYIGTLLPDKVRFFHDVVFPMKEKYHVGIYGQDWTIANKTLGFLQKVGQYLNIPGLKSIRKPALQLADERKVYSSSKICINIHEEYQKNQGDINERTFKIPAAKGFQICDNVSTIGKYFTNGKDIVIAESYDDWRDKCEYYINNPDKRKIISDNGYETVLKHHTYEHRIEELLTIYKSLT